MSPTTNDARGETLAIPVSERDTDAVPKLTTTSGPSAGRALAVRRAAVTVGRHPTNDLVVDDPRVSATHLELTRAGGRLRARDLASTNGTWLGEHRIVEADLAPGAELRIGDSVLVVGVEEGAAAPKPALRDSFGDLVGRSGAMGELFATLERIAPKELAVLIQGETGTGKEEIARAIHAASARTRGPFVVFDATALPEALAESLLFGVERGGVERGGVERGGVEKGGVEKGSRAREAGVFESASGGTVFIDGAADLSATLQSKLLRVFERKEVIPVGGQVPVPVDVRVLASTTRDLRNAIEKGRFREDLYFRLAQVRVFVPPLRQRREDIPLVAAKLLARAGSDAMIDVEALEHLAAMPWPGNVRELDNVLLRAAAVAEGGVIRRADIAGEGAGFRGTAAEQTPLDLSGTFAEAKERAIERFERAYLALMMKRCRGNLSAAARQADVARHHLRDLLRKRGLYGVSLDED